MKRIFIIQFIIFCCVLTSVSQEESKTGCAIKAFNERTKTSVNNYLNKQRGLINILLAKNCRFTEDSLFNELQISIPEDKSDFCKNINQEVDSIIIQLDNGLEWNLKSGPPKEPKRFYVRMFTKKGQETPEVVNRMYFLEFCSRFDITNENPCDIKDTYKVHTRILQQGKPILKAIYQIDLESKNIDLLKLEKL